MIYVAASGSNRSVPPGDELGQDGQDRVPLGRAAGRTSVGQRPGRQFGELLRRRDVLLPRSPRVRRSAGATRRGGWSPRSAPIGRRRRPPRGSSRRIRGTHQRPVVAQPAFEEVRDVRRNGRILDVTAGIGESVGSVPWRRARRQRGHTLVSRTGPAARGRGPPWSGRVAIPMALTESPPSSKKLALRSIESTPSDSDQMRCSVASICCCRPPVAAGTGSTVGCGAPAPADVRRDGLVGLVRGWPWRSTQCLLVGERIAGQRDASWLTAGQQAAPVGVDSGRPELARARAGRCRGRRGSGVGDASAERRGVRSTTAADGSPTPSGCRRDRPPPGHDAGSVSTASSSSENLTVALICRAHRAGSVASSAVIHVPVMFDSRGVCRLAQRQPREDLVRIPAARDPSNSNGMRAMSASGERATHARQADPRTPARCPRIRRPRSCPDR